MKSGCRLNRGLGGLATDGPTRLLGVTALHGETLHIAVNSGHVRRSRALPETSLRQFAVELQLRAALSSGAVELDGALSVLRLSAARWDDALAVRISDGRALLVEWGIFLAGWQGQRLWDLMWTRNPGLGKDLKRPAHDVLLTVMHPALVHHASLCRMLDAYEEDAVTAWRTVGASSRLG